MIYNRLMTTVSKNEGTEQGPGGSHLAKQDDLVEDEAAAEVKEEQDEELKQQQQQLDRNIVTIKILLTKTKQVLDVFLSFSLDCWSSMTMNNQQIIIVMFI